MYKNLYNIIDMLFFLTNPCVLLGSVHDLPPKDVFSGESPNRGLGCVSRNR